MQNSSSVGRLVSIHEGRLQRGIMRLENAAFKSALIPSIQYTKYPTSHRGKSDYEKLFSGTAGDYRV